MKFFRLALLSLLVLVLDVCHTHAQTYDLQFVVVENNGATLDVKLQIKATTGFFGMGDANLVFSFPTNVLSTPSLLTAHNFSGGFYAPISITQPSGRLSANIVFDGGPGLGTQVSGSFLDVATIRFDVLDPSGVFTLVWRTSGTGHTVVFNDFFALATPGTLADLSSVISPFITSHPTDQTVVIPLAATFSVTAAGAGILTYQWQKNDVNIGGATSTEYTTPPTTAGDSGAVFRCIVSNSGGSVTSNAALLSAEVLPINVAMELFQGWNLLSVPVTLGDYVRTSVFPSSISPAYAFDHSAGYVLSDTLMNGPGYWLKFDSSQTTNVLGMPRIVDTIEVNDGWNIIGSISNQLLPDSIVQIPTGIVLSSYFGYDGGYFPADTLKPGKGYWVKVSQPGTLVLR